MLHRLPFPCSPTTAVRRPERPAIFSAMTWFQPNFKVNTTACKPLRVNATIPLALGHYRRIRHLFQCCDACHALREAACIFFASGFSGDGLRQAMKSSYISIHSAPGTLILRSSWTLAARSKFAGRSPERHQEPATMGFPPSCHPDPIPVAADALAVSESGLAINTGFKWSFGFLTYNLTLTTYRVISNKF